MQDIRLDFISDIRPEMIKAMTVVRRMFLDLDSELQCFDEFNCHEENVGAAMRSVSIARTHIETSLQYAIKALCLIGENK